MNTVICNEYKPITGYERGVFIQWIHMKRRKVNTGKYNTFFCEGGEANSETIIFLHGSGPGANSETNWRNILPELTDRYHVIAPDYYGFGNSDHPRHRQRVFGSGQTAEWSKF